MTWTWLRRCATAGPCLLLLGMAAATFAGASERIVLGRFASRAATEGTEAGDGGATEGCEAAARFARGACRYDAQADYWLARGRCASLADDDERVDCRDEAVEELDEAMQECREQQDARMEVCDLLDEDRYDPDFDPANFAHPDDIGGSVAPNPYLPLVVGTEWVYESEDETVTVTVLDRIKSIDGVACRVVVDVVEVDGFPVEITDDWLAQDLDGNVWYCGESSRDFEVFEGDVPLEPELVSIDGSFKAGRDGAKPGILMLTDPVVGDVYREEAALGEAEDVAEIVDVAGTESAPAASCDGDCVVTRNFQALEPDAEEFKYYAPGIGLIVEIGSEGERVELVSFFTP